MNKPILVEIIIWCMILTAVFCAGLFGYSKLFIEPNIYNIAFSDIDGITKGSPVRYMGINVGYVRKLEARDKHINVQILVTKKDMKIPNGTVARVEFYGLGGSKSIELMPSGDVENGGIVTAHTLRLHDIIIKTEDLVDILEIIEKMVKGINPPAAQKALERVSELNDKEFKTLNNEIADFKANVVTKAKNIRDKQSGISKKIDSMNKMVDKINKFIKH